MFSPVDQALDFSARFSTRRLLRSPLGETHVPYWHEDAEWDPWPSRCVPFGGNQCSRRKSRRRQIACLEWIDCQLAPLLKALRASTTIACADHGDCWGENGREHGVSHPSTYGTFIDESSRKPVSR